MTAAMAKATRITEYAMYIFFGLALLPLAALEAHVLTYLLTHPDMLEVRDSALESPAAFMAVKFCCYLLVPAAISAICVLLLASREGKAYAAILMAAFCVSFYLISLGGQFAFNTWQRVYLESVPILALLVLVVALLMRRGLSMKRGLPGGGLGRAPAAPEPGP